MKNTYKRIFSGIGIIIIIIVIFIVTYGIRANSAMKKMSPIASQKFVGDIYAIQDSYVNLFLIKGIDKYIAIDGGKKLENVKKELQKLSINPNDVVAVFLTHTDFDHVAAIELFNNASVYLSKEEEQLINGEKSRFFSLVGNKINTQQYELIDDGQILNIEGIQVQGISTPGHTPGAMCYLINNSYLFTGDALRLKDGQINLFYDIFNMDTESARNSINKLANISEVEYIFTAHNGYSDDFNYLINEWTKQ